MDAALKSDLTKIVVEKLLIGAVILCLGIFTANRIEHFKSNQSFITEFNKLRVQKIGEVWEQVYVWEDLDEQNSAKVLQLTLHPGHINNNEDVKEMHSRMDALSNETAEKKHAVLAAANKNRFWIDEEQYAAITAYLKAAEDYRAALERTTYSSASMAPVSQQEVAALDADRRKKRATFSVIRAKLLRE